MRTRRQSFFLVLILGILNALTPFSIDMYLPAFPEIARDLNTTVARVALSVSMYFVGFAFGQMIYGPLLDRFGRKYPIYFGLSLYVIASIGCMCSTSMEMLLIFRCLSAFGGASASVGTMTMVRDLFPVRDAAVIFSNLMLVLSVSPLFAPSIGSLIIAAWGWRSLFGILSAIAIVDLGLVAFALPTSYVPDPNTQIGLRSIFGDFREILKDTRFRVFTFAGGLAFSGLFVFVAGSPAIFMGEFGLNAKNYGLVFAVLAMGMIGGGQLNHFLVRRFGSRKVFEGAIMLQTITGFVFLLAAITGTTGIAGTIGLLFVILLCAGVSYPNAAAIALEPFSRNAGSASSLLGFIQMGLGSLVSAGVGLLSIRGSLATAAVMAASTSIAMTIIYFNRSVVRELSFLSKVKNS